MRAENCPDCYLQVQNLHYMSKRQSYHAFWVKLLGTTHLPANLTKLFGAIRRSSLEVNTGQCYNYVSYALSVICFYNARAVDQAFPSARLPHVLQYWWLMWTLNVVYNKLLGDFDAERGLDKVLTSSRQAACSFTRWFEALPIIIAGR
jgi:hypothetical protein